MRGYATMIKVLFVCHGNICRSTMAESIMTHLVKETGRNDIAVYSAGTSTEEIGNPVYYATVDKLNEKGIKTVPHKAVQLTKGDYENYDYIIGMDNANIKNILRIVSGDKENKVYLMKDFTDEKGEVADPWYTRDFELTFKELYKSCKALLGKI